MQGRAACGALCPAQTSRIWVCHHDRKPALSSDCSRALLWPNGQSFLGCQGRQFYGNILLAGPLDFAMEFRGVCMLQV